MINQTYFLFIDQSGTPRFDANLPEDEGYCMAITAVSKEDISIASNLIRRRVDNSLIKSSDIEINDKMCSEFLTELFNCTSVFTAVVTAKCNDIENSKNYLRIKEAIDPNLKKKYGSKPGEIIRLSAFTSGFLKLRDIPELGQDGVQFEVIFDQESESELFKETINDFFIKRTKNHSGYSFNGIRFVPRDNEPLIMISDWIAGATFRDIRYNDIPLTQETLREQVKKKRVLVTTGFSVSVPCE